MRKSLRKYVSVIAVSLLLLVIGVLCQVIPAFAAEVDSVLVIVIPGWVPEEPPTLVTTVTTAPLILTGNITDTGGSAITKRGFVWCSVSHTDPYNTAPEKTNYEFMWSETGIFGEGKFYYQLPDLLENTDYYGRAAALNSIGWDYGDEVTFNPGSYSASRTLAEVTLPLIWIIVGGVFAISATTGIITIPTIVILFVVLVITAVGVVPIQAGIP